MSRSVLRSTLALGLLGIAALAIACGQPPAPPAEQATTAQAKPPAAAAASQQAPAKAVVQRLTVGMQGVGGDTDPYTDTNPAGYFKRYIHERLTETMTKGPAEPGLAASFRVVDPTTWEFRLKPDIRFSNGQPLTAADVKASYDWALDPARAYPSAQANAAVSIAGVDVVDPMTVRVRTKAPDPTVPARVSVIAVVPASSLGQASTNPQQSIGSGPFKFASFQPRQSAVLVPNETNTRDKPILTELIFRELPEPATRLAALRTGEIDIAESVTLSNLAELPSYGAKPVGAQLPFVQALNFDTNVRELSSRQVRMGLNYAIDRQEIIKQILGGLAEPANQPALKFIVGYNPDLGPFSYDQNRARQLLAEAGFPNGFTVQGTYPYTLNYRDVAQPVVGYLQRIGVRVEMEEIELAKYLELSRDRRLPALYLHSLLSNLGNDPVQALRIFRSAPGGRYNNPEFDRVHDQQATELDPARREVLLRQAMKLLHDDPPVIFLWSLVDVWGVSNRVAGMDTLATQSPLWWKVSRRE